MTPSTPPNQPQINSFWKKYTEITGLAISPTIDTSKRPNKNISSSLLCRLQNMPVSVQSELAELYLKQPNLTEGGFRNIIAIFGEIPGQEEIPIINLLTGHRRFSQVDAFELRERAYRLKTTGLREAIVIHGPSITVKELKQAVRKIELSLKTRALSPSAGR